MIGLPLPTAPRQCGGALQKFHYPLPLNTEAVHNRCGVVWCSVVCRRHCYQKAMAGMSTQGQK